MPKIGSQLKVHVVLRRLMREHRTTLTEISRATRISPSTLATWLTAKSTPNEVIKLAAVAKHFKISMHQLLFDEPDEAQPIRAMETETVLDGFYRVRLERVLLPKGKRDEGTDDTN